MGTATLLDIVGSMLISGLLLLTAMNMDERATTNTFNSQASLTVQENLTSLVENLEWDFRKIGYCEDPTKTVNPQNYIVYGGSDSISFVADLDNDGTLDTVSWYLGGSVPGCPNPNVRMLYRRVNNQAPLESNLGVTEFNLTYFDASDDTIQVPYYGGTVPSPQLMQLTVEVEPTAAYDTAYSSNLAVWRETRLVSRNLKNR